MGREVSRWGEVIGGEGGEEELGVGDEEVREGEVGVGVE